MAANARRWTLPVAIFVLCSAVYAMTAGAARLANPSPNNHFVHLAAAWLDGRLHVGTTPPGTNDWACFDTHNQKACPYGKMVVGLEDHDRYLWFVSFPPLPAAVIAPVVAIFGLDTLDRLFWILLAGLAPALLFLVLRWLREAGRSGRNEVDDLLLTGLFAFGSVYYFSAVQGTVWFAAHVVGCALICLYLLFSLDAQRPVLAGTMLGLCFLTRPTTLLLAPFFALESVRVARDRRASSPDPTAAWPERVRQWLAPVLWGHAFRRWAWFAVPIVVALALTAWHNHARFGDLTEYGHRLLRIRWQERIATWGLFSHHYFARNLAVFVASLPWLLEAAPYVRISRHGLALWFTTPNLLWTVWPKHLGATSTALWASVLPVALANLLYQNTGWVQFGYRFSLDYLPLLIVLLALCGRRFGRGFWLLALFAVLVNTFGAITFDRMPEFYDSDMTQRVIFQPD